MSSKQDDYLESGPDVDFDKLNDQRKGDYSAYDKPYDKQVKN